MTHRWNLLREASIWIILDIWSSLRSSGHSTCGRCVQSVKPTRTSRGRGQRTVVLPSQGGLDWLDAGTGNDRMGMEPRITALFDQQSCSFRQNKEICCKKSTTKHLVSVHWNGTIQPWSTNSKKCSARKLRMFTCKVEDLTSILAQSMAFTCVYPPNLGSCKHSLKPIRGQTGNLWLTLTNTQYWLPSWKSATHPCDLWMWGMPRPFQFGPVDPIFWWPFRSSDGAKHQINSPVERCWWMYDVYIYIYMYTLWWTNIAMENHHFEWVNPL